MHINNIRNIIIFTLFSFNIALVAMEIQNPLHQLPPEIQQNVTQSINMQPWWYLKETVNYCSWVTSVCINPKGNFLAAVPCNKKICIFNVETQKNCPSLFFDHEITSITFNASGTKLAALSCKPKIHIYSTSQFKEIESFPYDGAITSIYFDNNDNLLGVKSDSTTNVVITNLKTNKKVKSFDHNNWVTLSSICPSGHLLATGSGSNKVKLCNIKTKEEINTFKLDNSATALSFDASNEYLAIASRDNQVHIFELETNKKIASLKHDQLVLSLSFSSSSNLLATGCLDEKARIFARYDNYTLEQLLLKKSFITWLLIEKPNKTIDTITKLLTDVAEKHTYSYDELLEIWKTFPEDMQNALWGTMHHKIQTYGK